MSVLEKIDKILIEERDKKDLRIRSGLWSPSSFGRCLRYQYWNRLNEPKTNPINAQTLRTFKCGNLFHDFVQGILKDEYQSEVMIKTEDTLGYADLVGQDEVVDIKSVRSFQFKLMKGGKDKKGIIKVYDFRKEKKENILQVTYYAKNLGKKKGRLIFIDKDSLDVIEFEFNVSEFEKELQEELDMLNGYWKIKKLPPPLPRVYNGKECQYCSFSIEDKCKGG